MSFASQVDPSTTTKLPVGSGARVEEPVVADRALNIAVPEVILEIEAVPLKVVLAVVAMVKDEAVPVELLERVVPAVVSRELILLPVADAERVETDATVEEETTLTAVTL